MFRSLIITSAIAIAAISSMGAAQAKATVFNYPGDPCRTAAFNAAQAQWQESHTTDKGNLGGAAGYDELADQAQKSADRAKAQADNLRQAAKDNPKSADFWNGQAANAERDAGEWQKSADKYKAEAQKMRDEGKEYSDAAKKALEECLPLVALERLAMQAQLAVIARDLDKMEPKKTSSNEPSPPKQYYSVEPQYFVGLPHLYIEDGDVEIWDGWNDDRDHGDRHHRRHGNDHGWTDGDRDELPKIGKDHKLSKTGKDHKLPKMGESLSIEKVGKDRKLAKLDNGNRMGKLGKQSMGGKGSDRKIGKMMGGKNKMMGGKRKRKMQGMSFGL
jgi:hypothetical protein